MENNYHSFEDLLIWQEGMKLCDEIYTVLRKCKDFSLRDQMQRSAVSIPSNIAEGFERNTDKEFIHFLYIAKASAGEVRSQLYLALDLNYIEKNEFEELFNDVSDISKLISGFIKYLNDSQKS